MNIIRTAWKIFRRSGLSGLLQCRRDYYKSYPPLRKSLYYWLYSKLKINKDAVIELDGFHMHLNLRDYGLSKQLWISGFREPECTKYFKSKLTHDDVVLDIGANIGYYTLMESRYAKQVYALEPLRENYDFLVKNIKVNHIRPNVDMYQLAISDSLNLNGTIILYEGKQKNRANMFTGNAGKSVPCITVDDFCKKCNIKPTVIRMDIEGFEFFAIDGMIETLKKNNCKLFFEIHPYQMKQQGLDWTIVLKKLFKLGYVVKAVVKEYGPIREEIFYSKNKGDINFLEIGVTPDVYTHGFGLFMEK